jgi:tryptophan halogenase
MFAVTSWVQVMLGQHIQPRRYHPLADQLSAAARRAGRRRQKVIANCVEAMPMHAQFMRAIARWKEWRACPRSARLP